MIYLITGVAGFIGSYLAEELVSRDCEVIGVDNLFSGHIENIINLMPNIEQFHFFEFDATDYDSMRKIINCFDTNDIVYINMAAACLLYSLKHPMIGFNTEIKLNQTMCELARNGVIRTGIQFSTSEVYGGNSNGDEFDLSSRCIPKTTYAAGKLAADNLVRIYREKYDIDLFFIRPFNNFGERQENAIIPATIQRILSGKKPIVQGSGEQTRDFMYVKDTVKIIANILERRVNEDILLATGINYKVIDVVSYIMKELNYYGDIEYCSERIQDVDKLIGKRYNFNYTQFNIALDNTIKWHKTNFMEKK